jgi:acetolactate synthase regulatory subunit
VQAEIIGEGCADVPVDHKKRARILRRRKGRPLQKCSVAALYVVACGQSPTLYSAKLRKLYEVLSVAVQQGNALVVDQFLSANFLQKEPAVPRASGRGPKRGRVRV